VRFQIQQRYEAPVNEVVELFTDPTFYPTLVDLPKISTPEVVDHWRTGDTVRIDLRQRFIGDLPGAAQAVIDADKLSWVEQLEFDLRRSIATSVLVPDNYGDRFTCSGRYTFTDDGAQGTIRELSGDVKVRMLLVGGKVEGALVSGLREHAEAEAVLVAERFTST
jgi:Protein of unknown function (DUF2505)